jgi:hypothetical protein
MDILDDKYQDILQKLSNYITNNKDKIVNYRLRKEQGLVFTSQLAESTVESLINQRCKRQQQMRCVPGSKPNDPMSRLSATKVDNLCTRIYSALNDAVTSD